MLLENKNAVVYGAAGSLGSAVAHALAKAGARVFVTGYKLAPVKKLAGEIIALGGKAEAVEVDARNEGSVNDHLDQLVSDNVRLDISFNAVGLQDVQGIPLTEMSLDDFVRPVNIAMQTQFITATAVGRVMKKQDSGGVILSLTATPGGIGYPYIGGFGPACRAIEGFITNLAAELGPYKVRVVNMRSAGSPDSRVFKEVLETGPENGNKFLQQWAKDTMLKELPMMNDIANVAVFLASSMAKMITGVTVDVTAGTTASLNHNVPAVTSVQ